MFIVVHVQFCECRYRYEKFRLLKAADCSMKGRIRAFMEKSFISRVVLTYGPTEGGNAPLTDS